MPAQRTSSGPPPATSVAVNAPSDGPPATTVNISPAGPTNASHNIAPVQNTQSAATAPVAGPSFQATVGPDGPWYAITKGRAVGLLVSAELATFVIPPKPPLSLPSMRLSKQELLKSCIVTCFLCLRTSYLVLPYLPPPNVISLSAISPSWKNPQTLFHTGMFSSEWKLDRGNNVSGMRFSSVSSDFNTLGAFKSRRLFHLP
ncbi:hypothetical protein EDD18DRAFT_1112058 [Armillaria luteobubalina]|uniref:Uncharacterized protein n=1 Tax=Armillaria luteobubalina TaxID=153913 RepID=A0AA39PH65_9AGAR|nr:hypothetical protein EDD18DRAFT_1112058 [Armillaria luteobubalina]